MHNNGRMDTQEKKPLAPKTMLSPVAKELILIVSRMFKISAGLLDKFVKDQAK